MLRKTELTINEIAAAIADELMPLKEQKSRKVEQKIRATLEGSRWLMGRYSREAIRANRLHIKKLRNSICRLVDDILKTPRSIQISMFSGMSQPYGPEVLLNDLTEMDHRLLSAAEIRAGRDMIKRASAEIALNFFVFHSKKLPSSGNDKSPMRIVAGLVYEYFTGKADQDLERPCKAAIQKVRDHPAIRTNSRKKTARMS